MIDYLNSIIDTHQQWGKRPKLIVLPASWFMIFKQQLKDRNRAVDVEKVFSPWWKLGICFRGVDIQYGFRTLIVEFEEELPLED